MRKKHVLTIAILTIFLVVISATYFIIRENNQEVCFNENCFFVKIADNDLERQEGLMGVEFLGESQGMLFVFPSNGDYPFWMKNTLIPLDIIWINENYEVVYIAENQQPCADGGNCPLIEPNIKAKYVLEVNGGTSERIGLSAGDNLEFNTKYF